MQKLEITEDQVKELLPGRVSLVYVDYNSNFDNDAEAIAKAISKNSYEPLDESIQDWVWDCEAQSISDIKKELNKSLQSSFDLDEKEAEELVDKHSEFIDNYLYEKNDSDTIEDMLRNTNDHVFFYDSGHEVDASWGSSAGYYRLERYKIKKFLGIKDSSYDKLLTELIDNASSSGTLQFFFKSDVKDLIIDSDPQPTCIGFKNPYVAIVDRLNGSGYHVQLEGLQVMFYFDRANVYVDEVVKYSYTDDICGLVSSWCDGTDWQLYYDENIIDSIKATPSALKEYMKQQDLFIKTFNDGGCTFGDINMRRHRGTFYSNDFPCGTTCPHCKTFWVD